MPEIISPPLFQKPTITNCTNNNAGKTILFIHHSSLLSVTNMLNITLKSIVSAEYVSEAISPPFFQKTIIINCIKNKINTVTLLNKILSLFIAPLPS